MISMSSESLQGLHAIGLLARGAAQQCCTGTPFYFIRYEAGHLSFQIDEGSIAILRRIPVSAGTEGVWSARVPRRDFDGLTQMAEGAAYHLDAATNDRVVIARKDRLRYCLFRLPGGAVSPRADAIHPHSEHATASRSQLLATLASVAKAGLSAKRETCSLFGDGWSICGEPRLYWTSPSIVLPFDIQLRRSDALKLRDWLLYHLPPDVTQIEIFHVQHGGAVPCYVFITAEGRDAFRAHRSPNKVLPHANIDETQESVPTFAFSVQRRSLRMFGRLCNLTTPGRLVLRLDVNATCMHAFYTDLEGRRIADDAIPVVIGGEYQQCDTAIELQVAARQVGPAILGQVGRECKMQYWLPQSRLCITSNSTGGRAVKAWLRAHRVTAADFT